MVVWRFVDGKPGHESQSAGLVRALVERRDTRVFDLPVQGRRRSWLSLLLGGRCADASLPDPDLLVGAGHATHPALLACRRSRGGRAVVLMRPSLPLRWFDLCIVPEHDAVAPRLNVILSRGALNSAKPVAVGRGDAGLVLVGGPSAHHGWSTAGLREAVAALLQKDPRDWTIATSRRTPADTVEALRELADGRVRLVTPEQTAPGWLVGQMGLHAVAWVTEDSVSMLYEALTAGAACGVLPVPAKRPGRVQRGLQRLLDEGVVTSFSAWRDGRELVASDPPLDESGRCADWILDRWFAG
ncbi:MAG: mitochondrial fission ELM1 family protein [Gammaproteobacteria bacterium]|nr:mitochondrial fission ELM1 family protein [Gammaproteobacteria bacterium]